MNSDIDMEDQSAENDDFEAVRTLLKTCKNTI